MKKLTVIIVNYNVKQYVEQCLISLYRAMENLDAEIYVVDNNSQDHSIPYQRKRFKRVNFISSHHNLGFSRANNLVIRQTKSEYVLLLNPDTFVGEDVISSALSFMEEHEKAGALGVKMLKADGTRAMESRRGLPTPSVAFYKMVGLCSRYPKSRKFGQYYMGYLPWDEPGRIDVISGAFMMIRRAALEQVGGGLDEDYFMYGEDIDLSYSMLKAGYENWYLPLNILHYKGESTQKSSFRYVHVFYDAMLIFMRKHYGSKTLFISVPIKAAIYMKAVAALAKMLFSQIRDNLGIIHRRKGLEPLFVFIGNKSSLDHCRRIVKNNGLEALFFVGNQETLPEGHKMLPEETFRRNSKIYVVYDIDAYSFSKVLSTMEENTKGNISLGTYNHRNRTLITAEEVYQ